MDRDEATSRHGCGIVLGPFSFSIGAPRTGNPSTEFFSPWWSCDSNGKCGSDSKDQFQETSGSPALYDDLVFIDENVAPISTESLEDDSCIEAQGGPQVEANAHKVFQDGRVFDGDLLDGEPHGHGCVLNPNGDSYEGQWQHGVMHGEGTRREKHHDDTGSSSTFRGQWREGQKHGRGIEEWSDGTRYIGGFLHGKAHGGGVVILPSGLVRRVL